MKAALSSFLKGMHTTHTTSANKLLFASYLNNGIMFTSSHEFDVVAEVPFPVAISDRGNWRVFIFTLFIVFVNNEWILLGKFKLFPVS